MSVTFYHLTDLHMYSRDNWRSDPYSVPRLLDQIAYRETEDIFNTAIDQILQDKDVDIVIVTGDLTSVGDVKSHELVVKGLERLKEGGKRVYAYVASHDFPWENSAFYVDEMGSKHPVNGLGVDYQAASAYYKPYNVEVALEYNKDNDSIVVDLSEDVRYMALCVDYYKSNFPRITESSREWIKAQAAKAREEGKLLFASCHHPFLPPAPIYQVIGGEHDMVEDASGLCELLSEEGIDLIVTGHTHIHDVSYRIMNSGKAFYDVSTSALSASPPAMRKFTIDAKAHTVEVSTIVLQKLEGGKLEIPDLPSYCRDGFVGVIEKLLVAMGQDIDTFATIAVGISIKPETSYKYKGIILRVGKFLNNLTFGKLGNWSRKETGYKKADYADIKDKKVLPFLVSIVEKVYIGNADVSPDSREYRILLGTIAIVDSLVATLGIKLKSKLTVDTLSEFIEPLVFNNGIDDYEAVIHLDEVPTPKRELPKLRSKKGAKILILLVLCIIILLPILIPTALIVTLVILLKKAFTKKELPVEKPKSEDNN